MPIVKTHKRKGRIVKSYKRVIKKKSLSSPSAYAIKKAGKAYLGLRAQGVSHKKASQAAKDIELASVNRNKKRYSK